MKGRLGNSHSHSECHEFWKSNLTAVLVMELGMPTEKAPQEGSAILRDEVLRPSFSCKAQENQLKLGSEQELPAHLEFLLN